MSARSREWDNPPLDGEQDQPPGRGIGRRTVLRGMAASAGAVLVLPWAAGVATAAPLRNAGWANPAVGPLTSAYGWRTLNGVTSWHAGWDIGNPTGTGVYAAAAGTVVRRQWNAVPGRTGMGLVISHGGGIFTYYGHLSQWRVANGASVGAGQRVADMGATGNVTGPHLHFEVHQGSIGADINPRTYLTNRGVVLGGGWSTIDPGAAGASIRVVQELLNQRGESLLVDGDYGSVTQAAVRRRQQATGLVVDGQIGPATWPKLIYTLSRPSGGRHVRGLQRALNKRGSSLLIDGDFGGVTDSAVRAFQSANQLVSDGQAGPVTWRALMG